MDKRRQVILLVLILVFVVLTISRCAPDLPDEFPEPERGEVDSLPPAQQRPEMTIGPDESLVEGQIMLTGASGNVQQLVETVRTLEGLELRPLVSTTFTFLDEFPPPESGDMDIRQQPLGKRQRAGDPLVGRLQDDMSSLQIAIYDYPEESYTITETLQLIAGVALSLDGPVVAEPNYVTGFEITGSPWGVEG